LAQASIVSGILNFIIHMRTPKLGSFSGGYSCMNFHCTKLSRIFFLFVTYK